MTGRVYCELLVLLVGLLPGVSPFLSRPRTMVLENNQFKNMVIAIHESVAEDATIIDKLKDSMTEASKYLLKATLNRAYFKEITILLPSTWSGSYAAATSESLRTADVIISDTVRPKRSLPQARSYSGCGQQGVHILLSKDFLTNPRVEPYYVSPAKYFVHAFAQFRWGVFQEYSEAGENVFYFSLLSGHPEAVRCTFGIRGLVQKNDSAHTICYKSIDNETGVYTPDCLWRPYPSRQMVKASIMDHQWISVIDMFCNDDDGNYKTQHNYEAPSKHNRLCNHRSTWDVISNTEDFSGGKNPPIASTSSSAIVPNFKIVKAGARRKRAVVVVDDHVRLADADMDRTIARLSHESNIHDIEVTRRSREEQISLGTTSEADGDIMIHVKYNCTSHPGIEHILKNNQNAASSISTKGGNCSSILPTEHNHLLGTSAGHTMLDRLRDTVFSDHNLITIHREDINLKPRDQIVNSVHIDPTVGEKTSFIFHYELGPPDIVVWSPANVSFTRESRICTKDEQNKVVMFVFENAQVGGWMYSFESNTSQSISIIVSTTPTSTKHDPVIVITSTETLASNTEMSLSHHLVLHVDVTQGSLPVVGLNVTARIETPSGDVNTLRLLDNGAVADNSKNDGIYSRYFTKATTEGTYHVTATVVGRHGSVFLAEETFVMEGQNDHFTEDEVPTQRVMTKRSLSGNLQRHVTLGSVHVASSPRSPSDDDVTPPSRVTDLKVVRHLEYRNTLVLTWTAPGDDLDHGKVHRYELLVGQNITDVRVILRFDQTQQYGGPGNISRERYEATATAAEPEIILWNVVPSVNKFAFAIRGIDKAGNAAELSNVVTFGFVEK